MSYVDEDRTFAEMVETAFIEYANSSERSQQTTLGPSQLGGCREFIRATLAGDPQEPETKMPLPAVVGTVLGDFIEAALRAKYPNKVVTQHRVKATLPVTGLLIAGSTDAIMSGMDDQPNRLVDVKSKAGLGEIRRYGASRSNLIQLSTYFLALVQDGTLTENDLATLLYVDRSGREKRFETITIDFEVAMRWIGIAENGLDDVKRALEMGSPDEIRWSLRDERPDYCFAIECPFRLACWAGSEHLPTNVIDSPAHQDAIVRYVDGRDDEKDAIERKVNARGDLKGVEGVTPDGWAVSWTGKERSTINVKKVL